MTPTTTPRPTRPPESLRQESDARSTSLLALTRAELRMGTRLPAFRLAALAMFVLGWSAGGMPGRGVGASAYAVADTAWQYLGFVAVIWMSLAAVRDTTLRTHILVYSKPQSNERLVLAKFLGAFLQLLLILLAMFVGAILSRLYAAGGLAGFPVYGIQYLRAAIVLFFAASGSYCLALLFDSAVAGMLVALYWIVMLAGKDFLAKFYYPAYTQNQVAYLFFGLFLLCCALLFYRRKRRGAVPAALWVRLGAPLSLLLGVYALWSVMRDGHDPLVRTQPALEKMAEQDIVTGNRTPGFLLPDQYGRPIRLSDFQGKILVIALWSPRESDSPLLLARLNEIQAKYGAQGVQPVAICLSEDSGAAATFARGDHLDYPVVIDWGTYNAPRGIEISPLADAYRADALPVVVITDRRRRVRQTLTDTFAYDGPLLELALRERLNAEPE